MLQKCILLHHIACIFVHSITPPSKLLPLYIFRGEKHLEQANASLIV